MKIKDVPISRKSSMGTMETLGEIHYHYQKYDIKKVNRKECSNNHDLQLVN